jgi:hypothetical protein
MLTFCAHKEQDDKEIKRLGKIMLSRDKQVFIGKKNT